MIQTLGIEPTKVDIEIPLLSNDECAAAEIRGLMEGIWNGLPTIMSIAAAY
jgi:hypothetical protein